MTKRLCCLMMCLLLLCPAAVAENVQDSLVVGVLSTRTTQIDPLMPQERDLVSLYAVVYESLVTIDDNGLPQPLLAETWSYTGGGSSWTFTLREGITFSDGSPVTAQDVVASAEYILARAKDTEASDRGFYQNIRYLISSISATDERTVTVRAGRDYYGLLYAMTFPVVPASQVGMTSPIGSGPYTIQSFEAGSYLWLVANENWWQMQPQVREIMAMFYQSNQDLMTAFEYGRVDTIFTRSVAAAQYQSGTNSLSIAYSTRQLETLLLNHRTYPLDSVNVRQAIRYAINRDYISQNVYMGMTIDADTPVASDSWLYYDQENSYAYNPDRARELLAADGWSDSDSDGVLDRVVDGAKRNLNLQLCVYEDPYNDVRYETANQIVDMLSIVGIRVQVTTMTYNEVSEKLVNGSFEMAVCSFQMDAVPDVGFFLRKGNNENYCRYSSNDMTSLIDALRTQEEQADFYATTQLIQQQFTLDAPFVCLFYRSGAILTRKMYTTVRSIREFELLRGIEAFGR